MTQETVIDVMRDGLYTILLASAPPLLLGLAAGLIVSIFQAATSIQEQTLSFIPKILAVLGSLILFGPFILSVLTRYFQHMISSLPLFVLP